MIENENNQELQNPNKLKYIFGDALKVTQLQNNTVLKLENIFRECRLNNLKVTQFEIYIYGIYFQGIQAAYF